MWLETFGYFHPSLCILSRNIVTSREDFGLRWQSAATTPLFDCGQSFQIGVALRFPPQSKKIWLRFCRAMTLHLGVFALKNSRLICDPVSNCTA
jgi:hypothetical protein